MMSFGKMSGILRVALFFSLTGASAQLVGGREPQADTRHAQVRPYRGVGLCNYDRVMMGPNGIEVAIWENDGRYLLGLRHMLPPSTVIVGRMHNSGHSDKDKFFRYAGQGLRLYPIRWSRSGDRLHVRVREPQGRISAINADGGVFSGETPLAPEWKLTDISAITHGDVDLLNSTLVLQRVGRIDGKSFIRGTATLGSTVELLGARRRDLELVRIEARKATNLGINSGHTRLLTAFPNGRDYPRGISYLGAVARSDGDGYLPYQLPIVDLEAGRVAGKFGPLKIQLKNPAHLQGGIEQLNRGLTSGDRIILDASLSGQTLFALAAYYDGSRKLIRVDREGSTEKLICKRPASAQSVHVSTFRIDPRGLETSRQGSPIVVQYSASEKGPRDAVLEIHGGPGGSLADNYLSPPALRLLRPGRDIIAVEYAGSVGGGAALTRRLSAEGMDGLRQDMDSLAAWLSKRGYRKVYLLAGSFGSVPAMLLLSRHRNLISASFHTGPLLKLQASNKWAKRGGGIHSVNADTQLAYELASFGGAEGRQRFSEELSRTVAEAKLGQDDHLYFGDFDDISQADHLPSNVNPKILTFPRTGHAALGARSEVWRDLENNMK